MIKPMDAAAALPLAGTPFRLAHLRHGGGSMTQRAFAANAQGRVGG